jgi:hypothetical protein
MSYETRYVLLSPQLMVRACARWMLERQRPFTPSYAPPCSQGPAGQGMQFQAAHQPLSAQVCVCVCVCVCMRFCLSVSGGKRPAPSTCPTHCTDPPSPAHFSLQSLRSSSWLMTRWLAPSQPPEVCP